MQCEIQKHEHYKQKAELITVFLHGIIILQCRIAESNNRYEYGACNAMYNN